MRSMEPSRTNPLRKAVPYLMMTLGIILALYFTAQTAKTAKELQQGRYDDQQRVNREIEKIDKRQDELGCTLESLQRRHPELFDGAQGPSEHGPCEDERDGGEEQSTDSTDPET